MLGDFFVWFLSNRSVNAIFGGFGRFLRRGGGKGAAIFVISMLFLEKGMENWRKCG